MANKRMFSMDIIESDVFYLLPQPAQCLYMHMNLKADDDGFVSSIEMAHRMLGTSENDLEILIDKGYIFNAGDGIYLIRDWFVHNTLLKDRYHETMHIKKKSNYELVNKRYELKGTSLDANTDDNKMLAPCNHSIDKDSIDKNSVVECVENTRTHKKHYGSFENVFLSDNEYTALKEEFPNADIDNYIEKLSTYMSAHGKDYQSYYAKLKEIIRQDEQKLPHRNKKKNTIANFKQRDNDYDYLQKQLIKQGMG